jgi:hypothetical protein
MKETKLTYGDLQAILSNIPYPVPLWKPLNHLRNR